MGKKKAAAIKERVSLELLEVSPEMAKEILECNYQHQRRLDPKHVNYLAFEMSMGRFMEGTKIHICVLGDDRFLINGQHTLNALIQSGKQQTLGVQTTICSDSTQVADCFAHEDGHLRRSKRTVYRGYNISKILGLSLADSELFASACEFLFMDLTGTLEDRKPTPIEIIHIAQQLKWRFDKIKIATRRGSVPYSVGVTGLGLATANAEYYHEFWDGVATGEQFTRNDPRKAYRDFLMGDHKTALQKQSWVKNSLALFKVGAFCFNKFAAGKEIRQMNVASALQTNVLQATKFAEGFTPKSLKKLFYEEEVAPNV